MSNISPQLQNERRSDSMVGLTNTVLGSLPAANLGVTLPHEHVFIDLTAFCSPSSPERRELSRASITLENLSDVRRWPLSVRENTILGDLDLAVAELRKYVAAGGRSLVDLTNLGIGRDPEALARAAQLTGLNIICGCGYYMDRTHPTNMAEKTIKHLADEIVADLTSGIGSTGIRAGIIGEIGTSDPITPHEEKSLRAAAQAARRTGAPVNVHQEDTGRAGHRILDILEEEGLAPGRVVLSHLDYILYEDDYHASLAGRGAYVEYDLFGIGVMRSEWLGGRPHRSDFARVRMLRRLFDEGLGERLLCSHDVCSKLQLTRYGGFGYAHLLENMKTVFLTNGFSEQELDLIFTRNPAKIFGWVRSDD